MVFIVVLHQQVVQQASAEDPQEGHHISCLGIGEKHTGQKGKGDEAVAPHKEEDNLEAIVCEAKELEVDGGADKQQDGDVAAVDEEEPGILNNPVSAVPQPMHLHHDSQPVQFIALPYAS